MTDKEKLEKIRDLVQDYDPDFNFNDDHCEFGNYDASYKYGVDSGVNMIQSDIVLILNK